MKNAEGRSAWVIILKEPTVLRQGPYVNEEEEDEEEYTLKSRDLVEMSGHCMK
jgi:hypothetical protein